MVVEIGEIAGADVHRADAEAGLAGVDAIEIDQPLERRLERRGVVEAERLGRARRIEQRPRHARAEEAADAEGRRQGGAGLVEHGARGLAPERRRGRRPELTCSQNSLRRSTRVSGGLPAIRAALIAPIEMPATQSTAGRNAAARRRPRPGTSPARHRLAGRAHVSPTPTHSGQPWNRTSKPRLGRPPLAGADAPPMRRTGAGSGRADPLLQRSIVNRHAGPSGRSIMSCAVGGSVRMVRRPAELVARLMAQQPPDEARVRNVARVDDGDEVQRRDVAARRVGALDAPGVAVGRNRRPPTWSAP